MELSCDIVRDLVGVCTDHAASDDTNEAVQAHLAGCEACARYFRDYERIGKRHRGAGNRPVGGAEEDFRALSARVRRRRHIEMISVGAAVAAAAALTAAIFSALAGEGKGEQG